MKMASAGFFQNRPTINGPFDRLNGRHHGMTTGHFRDNVIGYTVLIRLGVRLAVYLGMKCGDSVSLKSLVFCCC